MKAIYSAIVSVFILATSAAAASSPYEGRWSGYIELMVDSCGGQQAIGDRFGVRKATATTVKRLPNGKLYMRRSDGRIATGLPRLSGLTLTTRVRQSYWDGSTWVYVLKHKWGPIRNGRAGFQYINDSRTDDYSNICHASYSGRLTKRS